ncbi:AraC family transcriptional regulator [Bradyrhizobium yuanmingense]|nr:AraC family transcriptional regulator [Bradyrhizobium yuanmingense]
MMPPSALRDTAVGHGLQALIEELGALGIDAEKLRRAAGLRSLGGTLTQAQRLAVLTAAHELTQDPLLALRAGKRQRVHHFGVYGFALATSPTFGDAFAFGHQHVEFAGAVLRITLRREGDRVVMQSWNPRSLRGLLPFVAEFWRASMVTLKGEILQDHFPSTLMRFPYPRPAHWRAYAELFQCPLEFESETMEWHFDAAVFSRPCPNASSLTANICRDFCEGLIVGADGESSLLRELRSYFLGNSGRRCTADEAAAALGLSRRTLFRRLAQDGTAFQDLLDQTRASLACEYLENTHISVSEIAERCGFGDEANFRRAFTRWRTITPSAWRRSRRNDEHASVSRLSSTAPLAAS